MGVKIGAGGNQISQELLQAAHKSLKEDSHLDKQDQAALKEAALLDGEITQTEADFITALGDINANYRLINQVRSSQFPPAGLDFSPPADGRPALVRAGSISPQAVARFKRLAGDRPYLAPKLIQPQLRQLIEADPQLRAKVEADPAMSRIYDIIKGNIIDPLQMQELKGILRHAGYSLPDYQADPAGQAYYDLETDVAFNAMLNEVAQRPVRPQTAGSAAAPLQAADLDSLVPVAATPKAQAVELLQTQADLARLESLGIARRDALALLSGMARIGRAEAHARLSSLLEPGAKAEATAEQLKQTIELIRTQPFNPPISLQDIGQVLINTDDPASLRHDPKHEQDLIENGEDGIDPDSLQTTRVMIDGSTSRDLGATLKARLMTFITLSEAGGEYGQLATLVKTGRLAVSAGYSADASYGVYQNTVNGHAADRIQLSYNNSAFRDVSLAELYAERNDARALRGTLVHEATHALDDMLQETGIRLPGVPELPRFNPDAEEQPGPGKQVNIESEFNAFYAEALYIARELERQGNYSPGRVLTALQRANPKETAMAALVSFIDQHVMNPSGQVSPQEAQALYDKVLTGLTQDAPHRYVRRDTAGNDGLKP